MISGMLVGYVYGPRMARSAVSAAKKMWKRAFLLYVLTVLLTFLFVWWGNMNGITHVKQGLWVQPQLGDFLVKTLILRYYYGWADFLPYYAIFMAVAPVALYAVVRGKAWLVLAVSAVCWLVRGSNFELSWQLLFMTSMVVGWYLPSIEAWARGLQPPTQRRLTFGLYAVALALLVASVLTIRVGEWTVHEYAGFASLPHALQSVLLWLDQARDFMTPLIVKWTLEPVRVVTAVVWFAALYSFVRRHEAWIATRTHGFLQTFGEHSLVVYVIHSIVIFGVLLIVSGNHDFLLNTVMNAAVIALVYSLVRGYVHATTHTKHKVRVGLRRLQLTHEEAL